MTILVLAEHIGNALSLQADDLRMEKQEATVIYRVTIGKQHFLVRVEELAKDAPQPAIT